MKKLSLILLMAILGCEEAYIESKLETQVDPQRDEFKIIFSPKIQRKIKFQHDQTDEDPKNFEINFSGQELLFKKHRKQFEQSYKLSELSNEELEIKALEKKFKIELAPALDIKAELNVIEGVEGAHSLSWKLKNSERIPWIAKFMACLFLSIFSSDDCMSGPIPFNLDIEYFEKKDSNHERLYTDKGVFDDLDEWPTEYSGVIPNIFVPQAATHFRLCFNGQLTTLQLKHFSTDNGRVENDQDEESDKNEHEDTLDWRTRECSKLKKL